MGKLQKKKKKNKYKKITSSAQISKNQKQDPAKENR